MLACVASGVSLRLGYDPFKALPQATPRVALLVRVLVVKVVAPHLWSGQLVVLTSVNRVHRDAQCLHEGGAGAAEVVGCPLAPFAIG